MSKSNNVLHQHVNRLSSTEDAPATPPPENYQYLFEEAKYADNGSINLVSSAKISPFNEADKSNEDLEGLEQEENKETPDIMNPVEPENIEQKPVIKAKAVFKKSGRITSREQRAKTISRKKEHVRAKRKSRFSQKSYAINYTKQDDHLKAAGMKKHPIDRWSPKRFKRYPRFTIFLSNCKCVFTKLNSV